MLAQVLGKPSPAPPLLRKQCLLRSGQGRADLTRTSLGKHLCQPDVCKVSRDRNQPQRARLILQALTQEELLTASQGRRPRGSAAEHVDPIHILGSVRGLVEYFLSLIVEITNLQSWCETVPPLIHHYPPAYVVIRASNKVIKALNCKAFRGVQT